jgi:hypothetical protein
VRHLKIGALVALFLTAIVVANLTLTHWGPSAIIPNAFFLIGLDLITRDRIADLTGTKRWRFMLPLIAAGGLLSYYLNADAARIALASVVAFSLAELGEAVVYHFLRKRPWVERAPKAAIVGAAIDSVLFITIAFGFDASTSFAQFAAKLAGAVVWTYAIARLLPPPSMAPAQVVDGIGIR